MFTLTAAAQETPTHTPTPPLPTVTPVLTPTSTPAAYAGAVPFNYSQVETSVLIYDIYPNSPVCVVHPGNGNLIYRHSDEFIETVPPDTAVSVSRVTPVRRIPVSLITAPANAAVGRIAAGRDGTLYGLGDVEPVFVVLKPGSNGKAYRIEEELALVDMVEVSGEYTPFFTSPANPGDLLLLAEGHAGDLWWKSKIFRWNAQTEEVTTMMDFGSLPSYPEGIGYGEYGNLFVMTREKMFRLDGLNCREWFHFVIPERWNHSFGYLRADGAFYVSTEHGILRVTRERMDKLSAQQVDFVSTNDATRLYFSKDDTIQQVRYTGPVDTFTPVPVTESPPATPTPVPALFVLDGYGGIHSSNAEVRPPVLPYIDSFNIMRDIEPDPVGRGWYMLDGYGGIHTSPNTLPKPQDLPYFGFDIARNLEIEVRDGQTYYYLLDGYGAIHTNAPDLQYGKLPWFGFDNARDLEPDPSRGNEGGWLVLDGYAVIHSSKRPNFDKPLNESWRNPQARAMIQFPFGETYLLDAFGGRHTNPCYPETNLMKEFTPEFYFPGFEIVWDVEIAKE